MAPIAKPAAEASAMALPVDNAAKKAAELQKVQDLLKDTKVSDDKVIDLVPEGGAAAEPVPESEEEKTVKALIARFASGDKAAATELAAYVKDKGVAVFKKATVLEKLTAAASDANSADTREIALLALAALVDSMGKAAEPYVVAAFPVMLDALADKAVPVRAAADVACKAVTAIASPHAVKVLLPMLFAGMDYKKNWLNKVGALKMLGELAAKHSVQVAACLPEIVPVVTESMCDVKVEVKVAGMEAMTAACKSLGNKDVEPFVPALIECIAKPENVPDTVHKLGATTFVQQVEAPTLAMLVPVLIRGLANRQTPIKRKACVIIDNMSKLVDNPLDAAVFLPRLLPGVKKVYDEVANPECRNVADRAHKTLLRVGAEGQVAEQPKAEEEDVLATLNEILGSQLDLEVAEATLKYIATQACGLIDARKFDPADWREATAPYLEGFIGAAEAEKAVAAFLDKRQMAYEQKAGVVEELEEGEELCNCEFSLAYGAKILLNNTRMRLIRGHRYGLCGYNGCGKSTLMRAIANGQVDGFPPKDVLRTVYVEHDIDGELTDMAVVEFVYADPILQDATHPSHGVVEEALTSVGFTPEMQSMAVGSLSGGWKMKLALARAMLMKADILLLDEPTNHLDVTNVAWLENYLTSLTDVTSMIVSHDSSFLDNVCTNVIHYEGFKLRTYKGNLSEFVKVRPEAKSYYSLAATPLSFKFPEPGFLEGVKNRDKAIIKVNNVSFTYPGVAKPQLTGVSVQCSMASRVACIGANGAGKSTLIKMITGELQPTSGTVWKHPNMRIAYVAQHAFHHIEQHLEKTPNQYIQWRYATGEDRENLTKVDRVVTEEEEKKMAAAIMHNGIKKVVEKLLGRRKNKGRYEYEVQWKGLPMEENTWLSREKLEEMGFGKMCLDLDIKEAARQGLANRPLTAANIEKHLNDVGIEPEFGTHSHMRGLSGGQKVKVVIAAAMWSQPHMLILDEPTNYLDRDSLGALAAAIKEYGGGVVIISHNREFVKEVCPETWVVANGVCEVTGGPKMSAADSKLEWKPEEEAVDAFGNTIKVKSTKVLTNKEKKAKERLKKLKKKQGLAVEDSEDEEDW